VEEDHIQMGNSFVHVYKMKFSEEELDYIPYIICGDQKLSYYVKYGRMPNKVPYYPQPTDSIGTKQMFSKVKPLIDYDNVYVPKRDLKNQVFKDVYVHPPQCLKFAIAECLQNAVSKWYKGTLI